MDTLPGLTTKTALDRCLRGPSLPVYSRLAILIQLFKVEYSDVYQNKTTGDPLNMLFSRACEHGIRAVLYLASIEGDAPVQIKDIAEALDVPFPFLAKIVQSLSRKGVLRSQKGPGGGVALAADAGQTSLLDVIDAIDGLRDLKERCVLGLPQCSSEEPCALHEEWGQMRDRFVKELGNRSVLAFGKDTPSE